MRACGSTLVVAAASLFAARSAIASPSDADVREDEMMARELEATEPEVRPTLPWLLVQLVPSPEAVIWTRGAPIPVLADFGLRWQVTPLLYSFGIRREYSPWRTLVAEPIVRASGSVEAYVSPEFVNAGAPAPTNWFVRGGVRATFPVLEKGEGLAVSAGAGAIGGGGLASATAEVGAYFMSSTLGIAVAYAPSASLRMTTVTFRVRYF